MIHIVNQKYKMSSGYYINFYWYIHVSYVYRTTKKYTW